MVVERQPEGLPDSSRWSKTTGTPSNMIQHPERVRDFLHPSRMRQTIGPRPEVFASLRPPATFSQLSELPLEDPACLHALTFELRKQLKEMFH